MRITPKSCKCSLFSENCIRETNDTPKLTFDEWFDQKATLSKQAKRHEKKLKKQEEEKKKAEEDEKSKKKMKSEAKFREWQRLKSLKTSSTAKLRCEADRSSQTHQQLQDLLAKQKYQEWLRSSLKNLKEVKKFEKQAKKREEEEKKKKEDEFERKIEKAKEAYNKWLQKKKKIEKIAEGTGKKQSVKSKQKILMLAYSPNRKKNSSLSSLDEISIRRAKKMSTANSNSSEEMENPILWPIDTKKSSIRKSEDYQVIEELSSIHKSPKVRSICQDEIDVESFIMDLEQHELV